MLSLHLTLVLAGLSTLVSAATEVKLIPGVCGPYPGSFQSSTGNAYVGELNLKPVTGTYIDTLGTRFGTILETQRQTNPWYTLALYNETGYAAGRVGCRDEDGLAFLQSTTRPIRINTERDGTLVVDSYGLIPEPYAYHVDGERQPGIYIGAAGEVRWAWSPITANGIAYWKPRLMVATDRDANGSKLREGEVEGFLVAMNW